jgi:hypothetical protein
MCKVECDFVLKWPNRPLDVKFYSMVTSVQCGLGRDVQTRLRWTLTCLHRGQAWATSASASMACGLAYKHKEYELKFHSMHGDLCRCHYGLGLGVQTRGIWTDNSLWSSMVIYVSSSVVWVVTYRRKMWTD